MSGGRQSKRHQRVRAAADADRLGLIATFISVAGKHSFTAAAVAADTHSSTLSRRVSRLEDALGVRLLNRTTRTVSLTEAGRLYLTECLRILEDVANADAMVSAFNEQPRGLLRVSMPVAFGQRHLGPAIARFLSLNPEVQIEADLSDAYVDMVAEEYDVAVRIGRLQDSGLVVRKIADNRRRLVASKAYLARNGTPTHPQDLLGHNCLRYSNYPTLWRFDRDPEIEEIAASGSLISGSSEVIYNAVLDGVGIGLVAEYMCYGPLASGEIVSLLPEWTVDHSVGIYVVFPSRQHLPPKTRAFADFLTESFRNPVWSRAAAARG